MAMKKQQELVLAETINYKLLLMDDIQRTRLEGWKMPCLNLANAVHAKTKEDCMICFLSKAFIIFFCQTRRLLRPVSFINLLSRTTMLFYS